MKIIQTNIGHAEFHGQREHLQSPRVMAEFEYAHHPDDTQHADDEEHGFELLGKIAEKSLITY